MKKTSIKAHLKKYSIFQKRSTTINHAFASALAPVDEYSEQTVDTILRELECSDGSEIVCAYCGRSEAQTWDHLFALVKDNEPSGYGHKYGNLVPACKECNSKKGNRSWEIANEKINADHPEQKNKVARIIKAHIEKYPPQGKPIPQEKKKQIDEIKAEILKLMKRADKILSEPIT
jgi:5-methylcytosine-specific restriction endonuclease McrA